MELGELELTPLSKSGPTQTKVVLTIDLISKRTSDVKKFHRKILIHTSILDKIKRMMGDVLFPYLEVRKYIPVSVTPCSPMGSKSK